MQWDYIIVGAGSSGCALAYQLVQAGHRVLLLEAGGSDRSVFIKLPAAVWRTRPQHDWGYHSQPDPTRHDVTEAWNRGRVLGGTSSINGMIYVRGAPEDFDRWSDLCGGTGGWSAKELVPYFKTIENSDQDNDLRGHSGRVHVRTVRHPHPLTQRFVESTCAAGYPLNPDYNGISQEGVGYLQLTQHRGFRWSAADAFIKPIRSRGNFELRLHTLVDKIEVTNGRATAVLCRRGGELSREAAREVIVCAGAVNSPRLLLLSGIGDPQDLTRLGIPTVLDLPGVGRNLREHAYLALSYRSKVPTNNLTRGPLQKLAIAAKYLFRHEGPIAAAYEATAFIKLSSADSAPPLQVFFAPIGWEKKADGFQLSPYPAFKIVILRSHSQSSGRIRLASADRDAPPIIECRLLEDESDVQALAKGVEAVRRILHTRPIADCIESETEPGPIAGLEPLRAYIRSHAGTACHPMGSCRMGLGADAVVGPNLRVRGTQNLWIADASIMPDAISANLNAVCMMLGTKLGKELIARSHQDAGTAGSAAAAA